MDKYIGILEVEVEKMTAAEYAEHRGWDAPSEEVACIPGYRVVSRDGSDTWYSDVTFNAIFTKSGDNVLIDAALLTKSDNFKHRLKGELMELDYRLSKLEAYTTSNSFADRTEEERHLMIKQQSAMSMYYHYLKERVKRLEANS